MEGGGKKCYLILFLRYLNGDKSDHLSFSFARMIWSAAIRH